MGALIRANGGELTAKQLAPSALSLSLSHTLSLVLSLSLSLSFARSPARSHTLSLQAVGALIRANGGALTADQLAPYVDPDYDYGESTMVRLGVFGG